MSFTRVLLLSLIAAFAFACASSSKKKTTDEKPDTTEGMDADEKNSGGGEGNADAPPADEAMPAGAAPDGVDGEEEEADEPKKGGTRGIGSPGRSEPEEEEPPGATGDDGTK